MRPTTMQDWYDYLRLPPDAGTEEIQHAVERLSRQAAALATTAPERSQSLRETVRSIKRDLLSGPDNRQRYDASRAREAAPAAPPPAAPPPVPAQQYPRVPARPPAAAPAPLPPGTAGPGMPAGSRLARFLRTGWTCSACGKGGVPSDKFCTRCGGPIRLIEPHAPGQGARSPATRALCAGCANPMGALDVFCSKCGTRR